MIYINLGAVSVAVQLQAQFGYLCEERDREPKHQAPLNGLWNVSQSLDLILYYGGEVQSKALHFTLELSAVKATGWLQQNQARVSGMRMYDSSFKLNIFSAAEGQLSSMMLPVFSSVLLFFPENRGPKLRRVLCTETLSAVCVEAAVAQGKRLGLSGAAYPPCFDV